MIRVKLTRCGILDKCNTDSDRRHFYKHLVRSPTHIYMHCTFRRTWTVQAREIWLSPYVKSCNPVTPRALSNTAISHLNYKIWTLFFIPEMPCNVLFRWNLHYLTLLWFCGLPCWNHSVNCLDIVEIVDREISRVHGFSCCGISEWEPFLIMTRCTRFSSSLEYVM